MASAIRPHVTPKKTTSVDPLYTAAVAQAKTALAAASAPIQNEQAASDASFKQRQTDALGVSEALSKLLKGIGPAVNGEYQTAAQNQELAANGFSHGMQDALQGNTDSLNAMLQKLGSPTTLDSHASEAGDVTYALGGYNPGTMLSTQGAAFGAAAELQSGAAALKGQENVKSLQAQSIAADQGFQQKIAEMAGKLPGDIQTNYQKLRQLALADAKFTEQLKNDKFNEAYKRAQFKLEQAKYGTSVQEFNIRQDLAERKFAQQQTQQDRVYQVSLQQLGIAEKGLQLRIAANAFKQANGGYSSAKIASFNQKLDSLQGGGPPTHAVDGVMPAPVPYDKDGKVIKLDANGKVPPGQKAVTWQNHNTYARFIRAALKKGVPIQLALERADSIWPEMERGNLGGLAQLPAVAADAAQLAQHYAQQTAHSLGIAPNGTPITVTYNLPKTMSAKAKSTVQTIISSARDFLGTPYAWGGESSTGFDCSGLAQYLYSKVGISIPRTTYDQFKSGLNVPRNQLLAGDLVFFKGSDSKNGLPGHVGIYVGGGMMIDAPHTGDVVKVERLHSDYVGARRYVHS